MRKCFPFELLGGDFIDHKCIHTAALYLSFSWHIFYRIRVCKCRFAWSYTIRVFVARAFHMFIYTRTIESFSAFTVTSTSILQVPHTCYLHGGLGPNPCYSLFTSIRKALQNPLLSSCDECAIASAVGEKKTLFHHKYRTTSSPSLTFYFKVEKNFSTLSGLSGFSFC